MTIEWSTNYTKIILYNMFLHNISWAAPVTHQSQIASD